MSFEIRRGDIFYINRFGKQIGSEQHSGRPGIVVSNDENNRYSQTVEVVYCTTKPKEDLPTHVTVLSTTLESVVLCEQVTTVSVDKLGNYIGSCTPEEMDDIDYALRISLGLDPSDEDNDDCTEDAPNVPSENFALTVESKETYMSVQELRIECETYKKMYYDIVDRILAKGK